LSRHEISMVYIEWGLTFADSGDSILYWRSPYNRGLAARALIIIGKLTGLIDFEDLLDLVDVFAHRTLAEDGVVMFFPENPLPLDIIRFR
jgi:hypothetical protein